MAAKLNQRVEARTHAPGRSQHEAINQPCLLLPTSQQHRCEYVGRVARIPS